MYHTYLPLNPKVRVIGPQLKKSMGARWKEYPDDLWWAQFFEFISQSRFLTGRIKDWSAGLQWICGPKNFERILNNEFHRQESAASEKTKRNLETLLAWRDKDGND